MKQQKIYLAFALIFLASAISFSSAETFGYGRTEQTTDKSTTYYPSSYQIITGTPSGGNNIGNLSYYDGQIFSITEAVGSPAINFEVNFTNVTSVDYLLMRGQFVDGSSDLLIQILTCDSVWQNYRVVNSETAQTISQTPILDPEEHICDGTLRLRAYVNSNGNPSYLYSIDFIQLVDGTSALTSNVHDSLSERNLECTNHPWVCVLTNALQSSIDSLNSTINSLGNVYCALTGCTISGNLNVTQNITAQNIQATNVNATNVSADLFCNEDKSICLEVSNVYTKDQVYNRTTSDSKYIQNESVAKLKELYANATYLTDDWPDDLSYNLLKQELVTGSWVIQRLNPDKSVNFTMFFVTPVGTVALEDIVTNFIQNPALTASEDGFRITAKPSSDYCIPECTGSEFEGEICKDPANGYALIQSYHEYYECTNG